MINGFICSLVSARAMGVEPFARALYPDPLDSAGQPFVRSRDRWRTIAALAAPTRWRAEPDTLEVDQEADAPGR